MSQWQSLMKQRERAHAPKTCSIWGSLSLGWLDEDKEGERGQHAAQKLKEGKEEQNLKRGPSRACEAPPTDQLTRLLLTCAHAAQACDTLVAFHPHATPLLPCIHAQAAQAGKAAATGGAAAAAGRAVSGKGEKLKHKPEGPAAAPARQGADRKAGSAAQGA
eukprot:scaffold83321_cov17-Tisochrysis_lutea.AAC.1